ncbi:MAG: caspase family protein [Caldilineaceae bacterium]
MELITKLRAIRAKRLLLILNACHAGALSPSLSLDPFEGTAPPAEATAAILATGEGRIIITACRPEQKSWVGRGQLTLFAQALVDGLRGQGYVPNRGGYVSAFGLYEHLYATVKEQAAALGHIQEPELTVLRGVGPFPVSLYRGATTRGDFAGDEPLPEETATQEVTPEQSRRLLKRYVGQSTVHAEARGVAIGGAVRGSTIVTGDGNTVQQHRTVFDRRGQTVGGSQTNIAGDVNTGGAFNSGFMESSQPNFAVQLRQLRTAIIQAGAQGLLDEESVIDADAALQKALRQAEQPTPDRQAIRRHLLTAQGIAQNAGGAGQLVGQIAGVAGSLG